MNTFSRRLQILTRSPIVWGVLGAAAFFALIHAGPLGTPFIKRYFTGHPVEYAETVMFVIGLAALAFKTLDIVVQNAGLARRPWAAAAPSAQPLDAQCQSLLEQLQSLPARIRSGYYIGRLRAAVEYVWRRGAADGLDDELKFLADADAGRLHSGYGLFRIIVWAIPIMGFLGTVIGITMALNGIDRNHLDESMAEVTTGLGVKFDTTALALSMSMVLMFIHFFVERAETALLGRVDRRVQEELTGRFPQLPPGADGHVLAVRRMAEAMIQTTERLVARQAELWQASMEAAAVRWARMTETAAELVKQSLAGALAESIAGHAQRLVAAEHAAAEQNRQHWDRVQQAHGQNAQALASLQAGVVRQAEVLQGAIEAAGEVGRLETALNRNLGALAGAQNFEQTVLGLAAAIHLLNARLASTAAETPAIHLEPRQRTAQAA